VLGHLERPAGRDEPLRLGGDVLHPDAVMVDPGQVGAVPERARRTLQQLDVLRARGGVGESQRRGEQTVGRCPYLLFSLEYRRIASSYVNSKTATADIIGLAAGYRF